MPERTSRTANGTGNAGLDEDCLRPQVERLRPDRDADVSRYDDDREVMQAIPQNLQELDPAFSRQVEIHQKTGIVFRMEAGEEIFRRPEGNGGKARCLEQDRQRIPHRRVILHDINGPMLVHLRRLSPVPASPRV